MRSIQELHYCMKLAWVIFPNMEIGYKTNRIRSISCLHSRALFGAFQDTLSRNHPVQHVQPHILPMFAPTGGQYSIEKVQ